MKLVFAVLRFIALWAALVIGAIAANKLSTAILPSLSAAQGKGVVDGPLSAGAAFVVVNGLVAFALWLLAENARVRGARLAVLVFVALFGIQTFMQQIEVLFFNSNIGLPLAAVERNFVEAAIVALLAGAAAALLFRGASEPDDAPLPLLWLRIVTLTLLYVVIYFVAGILVQQNAAVRAFYGEIHVNGFAVIGFQLFRGLLWALLAYFVADRLRGHLSTRAALMAVLFTVLTAAQLLYPNDFMPWPVRLAHLCELTGSEIVYGIAATLIFARRARGAEA